MHPRLVELENLLDEHQMALTDAVKAVPAAQRTTQPAAGTWSVAEVLEHLVLVERRITTAIRSFVDEARSKGIGEEDEDSPILPKLPTTKVLDRSNKRVAGEGSRPTGRMSVDESLRAIDE